MSRDAAIAAVSGYFDGGGFRSDLADLVSYETESQVPGRAPELTRYLEHAMLRRLAALGFDRALHDNPVAGGANRRLPD